MPQPITSSRTELFRREDAEDFLLIVADVDPTCFTLFTHDISAAAKHAWGDDDHESWVKVPKDAWPQLLLALTAGLLRGRADAETVFRQICDKHHVPREAGSWA